MSMLLNPFWAAAGGGEFDPTAIATCTEWVSADQPQWAGFTDGQAIGDATHRWEDRTGSGRYWEQPSSGNRPTFHDTDGKFVQFDSNDFLGFSNGAGTIFDTEFTSFIVASPGQNGTTAGSELGPNLYTQNGYLGLALFDAGGGVNKFRAYRYNGGYVGVNSQTTYTIDQWYLIVFWYDGTDLWIQVNGDTPQSVTTSAYASDADTPNLCFNVPCLARYKERITYDSNISSTDRNFVRTNLATKHGITI